ncbi:Lso2 protein [Maudiozyma humilis]|uniref:Lso2 protein n=1 Tax=Maudiozyma humilis TaxID=51915 RepID=A0AAV5RW69_MAUHU|nr:Lso2 protein [Kazachstania humilis]
MGKRFSESAAKKVAGQARKRDQANAKARAEEERLEAIEASKWEEGAQKVSKKQLLEEEKRREKERLKAERDAQMAEEEAELGVGGKGRSVHAGKQKKRANKH